MKPLSEMAPRLMRIYCRVRDFFAEVPGSLKAHLNTQELVRIAVAALSAGGGAFGVLQALLVHAGTIFPAPLDAALAAFVLTTILETLRRLDHGDTKTTQGLASRRHT